MDEDNRSNGKPAIISAEMAMAAGIGAMVGMLLIKPLQALGKLLIAKIRK